MLLAIFLILASLDNLPKETGVFKLTSSERAALEKWINNNYTKKDLAQNSNKKKKPILQENLKGGHYIRLSDGTLWEINPSDTPITQGWITPVDIEVSQNNSDTNYPYMLKNTLTGSSVQARQATLVSTGRP